MIRRKKEVAAARKRLANLPSASATVVPGMAMPSLVGPGDVEGRTKRQKQIAKFAQGKLARLLDRGAAGVSAAAPKAKAKTTAKPKLSLRLKAKAKATTARPTPTVFYAHGVPRPHLLPGQTWTDKVVDGHVVVVRDLAVVQQARDSYLRLDRPLLAAMLLGKRVAAPQYCGSATPGGGSSILFVPAFKKKLGVFFTPHFKDNHGSTLELFRRALRTTDDCQVAELPCQANAEALAKTGEGMVIGSLQDFSTCVRKLVHVARERAERGTYRKALV